MNNNDTHAKEIATLRKLAIFVVSWLVVMVLVSLSLAVSFLNKLFEPGDPSSLCRTLLCVFGGMLGSSICALISVVERVSNGWELSRADMSPSPEPEKKFMARMALFYIVWPFFGSAMGLIVYVGIQAGYLLTETEKEMTQNQIGQASYVSRYALMFFSFLGGLVAEKFIKKLQAMFGTLFGGQFA